MVSFVTLASGGDTPDFEALLMPFDFGTVICVAAPGLRPAPARRPALGSQPSRLSGPRGPLKTQKKLTAGLLRNEAISVPYEAHLKMDHDGIF